MGLKDSEKLIYRVRNHILKKTPKLGDQCFRMGNNAFRMAVLYIHFGSPNTNLSLFLRFDSMTASAD